jgi:hypothetical protein
MDLGQRFFEQFAPLPLDPTRLDRSVLNQMTDQLLVQIRNHFSPNLWLNLINVVASGTVSINDRRQKYLHAVFPLPSQLLRSSVWQTQIHCADTSAAVQSAMLLQNFLKGLTSTGSTEARRLS